MIMELKPTDGRKSFYGKAIIEIHPNGIKVLKSYGTYIMMIFPNGSMYRLWDDWTQTTGRHIKAFCGLNKSEFMKLDLVEM
jgi:hypothetical protein